LFITKLHLVNHQVLRNVRYVMQNDTSGLPSISTRTVAPIMLDGTRTRIVVDSSSNVPNVLLQQYRMLEVPALVNFGTESFRNNLDLSQEDFYARLLQGNEIPTTSQPPPHFFAAAYRQALAEGAKHVVVVTVSAKFSGTFASAQSATQGFDPERFTLWDSDSASIGSGWQAISAARLLERGVEQSDLLEQLAKVRAATIGYATVETLKYAARSGRLSNLQAGLGDLLQVKAIMEVIHGRFAAIGRVRGRKRSLHELVDRFQKDVGSRPVRVAIAHANVLAEAKTLADDARAVLNVQELLIVDVGPAIATLAGPGTLALLGHPVDL
jgi:DegV family protein with EDD domain